MEQQTICILCDEALESKKTRIIKEQSIKACTAAIQVYEEKTVSTSVSVNTHLIFNCSRIVFETVCIGKSDSLLS